MGRRCVTCEHPAVETINRRLVAGEFATDLGPEYGLTPRAVIRHRSNHIPAHLARAQEAATIASADSLMAFLTDLRASALAILRQAEAGYERILGFTQKDGRVVTVHARDHALALEAIDRLTKLIELIARVAGQLPSSPTVNLFVSPEWAQLRSVILAALVEFPQARVSVALALAQLAGTAQTHTLGAVSERGNGPVARLLSSGNLDSSPLKDAQLVAESEGQP